MTEGPVLATDASRPTLSYVELHVVEHCNLTCNRCGHFSPVAPERFTALDAYERDIARLAQLFENVEEVRLMGGEPLLHPEVHRFAEVTRAHLPRTNLRIATNGTRLKSMPPAFWDVCRRTNVFIDVSIYPITEKAAAGIDALCAEQGVGVELTSRPQFLAGLNPRGDSDPAAAMAYCRSHFYNPFLADGRLHVCSLPVTARYFNDHFGRDLPLAAGIDIHDPGVDGAAILQYLETPVDTCRHCTCEYEWHEWKPITIHRASDYETA